MDIVEALKVEIQVCHESEKFDDLLFKRNILAKVVKLVRQTDYNQ